MDATTSQSTPTQACDDYPAVASAYLGRQPIVDRHGSIAGFELLFRQGVHPPEIMIDGDCATAQVVENTIATFGISSVLAGHPGYVNVTEKLLMSEAIEALPPEKFVLEILEDVALGEAVIERCRSLRALGYHIALDDVTPLRPVSDAVLSSVDMVKIDVVNTPAAQLPALVERFRRSGMRVLAEKVETREAFERSAALGCSLFQGYFFARPEVLVSRKARASGAPLLRIIRLLHNEPRLDELEEALKASPDIVMHVLRLANAAAEGAYPPVQTLRAALGRLGTERLTHWIYMLLYTLTSNVPLRANPLVQLVGARARFMELAARLVAPRGTAPEEFASQASLAGMLSLAHVLLRMDVLRMLDELRLAPAIVAALARREGDIGTLLRCAQALETGDETAVAIGTRRWPDLTGPVIAKLGVEAACWAAQQMR